MFFSQSATLECGGKRSATPLWVGEEESKAV